MSKRPKYWFAPYNMYSESVSGLVDHLGARIIKRQGSTYRQLSTDVVINWGSGEELFGGIRGLINPIAAVRTAISKTRTFDTLRTSTIPTVDFTRERGVAQGWLAKSKVLGRDSDRGRSGQGITIYREGTLGEHAYYCKYYRKEREFRIHVFNGQVIFEQEKKLKTQEHRGNSYDKYIRSHTRGWAFAFHHLVSEPVPEVVRQAAIASVVALGLHFGGVDVGWNSKSGACVFEINTAPGIENSSLEAYVTAIRSL